VLVDVEWCGICGTDVEEYTSGPIVIPTEPHPLTGHAAPMIIGHEVSGRVAQAGPGVALAPGTAVALDGYLFCGSCRACRQHAVQRCDRWAHIGMSHPGGLAEQLVVPARMAIAATAEIGTDELALAEPLSVAVRATRRARLRRGESVLVVGGGTIGLAVVQAASTREPSHVDLIEPLAGRRSIGVGLGTRQALAGTGDAERLRYDVVFDCTGSSAVLPALIELPRRGGRIVMVGLPPQPATVDVKELVLRELSIIGTVGHVYDEDFQAAVELLCSGRADAKPLITHRLPLSRAVEDGIAYLAGEGRSHGLKVLVSPGLRP
jgi:(R,R)-butanediol dehydrogenase/meso-butanediol dehydrogenase/diacetyl reductase